MQSIEELVQEAQAGKEEAFGELCRRFTGLVRSRAGQSFVRSIREDMEGAAWLAFAKAVREYRSGSGHFEGLLCGERVSREAGKQGQRGNRCSRRFRTPEASLARGAVNAGCACHGRADVLNGGLKTRPEMAFDLWMAKAGVRGKPTSGTLL